MQELQKPMEFSHQPILVRGVSASNIINKITFKNRRKVNRHLYGIGMPIEIQFNKPDNAKIEPVKTNPQEEQQIFSTNKTKILSCNIDDF